MLAYRFVRQGVALSALALCSMLPALAQDKAAPKVAPETLNKALGTGSGPTREDERSIVKCPDRQMVKDALKTVAKSVPRVQPSAGSLPPDCAEVSLPESEVVLVGIGQTRGFDSETYNWTAPGLMHLPIYFEDLPLERYGQTRGYLIQPLVSSAKFFAVWPTLPYRMSLDPPRKPIYTYGYERPGDCFPTVRNRLPFSPRAAVNQVGVTAGLILLIP